MRKPRRDEGRNRLKIRVMVFVMLAFLCGARVSRALAESPVAPDLMVDPATGMEFVHVKGGCFQMGDTFGEGDSDEFPVHEVCVSGFLIGKYMVTQDQWVKIMGSNPSRFQKGGDYPVENVSWEDAQRFIVLLNEKSGRKYRLPTEAEWEYAARSGGKNERYAGTSRDSQLKKYAWYYLNSRQSTNPVGKKLHNEFGLYDMTGILWEWCSDWYGSRYYNTSPRNDPTGLPNGFFRSLRGGSWDTDNRNVRIASRYRAAPETKNAKRGFRLLLPVGGVK